MLFTRTRSTILTTFGNLASDNIEAADRVIAEIFDAIRALVPFPHQGTAAQTSPAARCVFNSCGIT
jgi:plasmid stabilization system protein ParE